MDMKIRDARGTSQGVGVDSNGRLSTVSTVHSSSQFASRKGDAFSLRLSDTVISVGVGDDWMIYLKNTDPNKVLIIERIIGSVSGPMQFQIIRDPDVTTVGQNNTSIEAEPLNFGSAAELPGEAYVWDGVAGTGLSGISGGRILIPLRLPAATVVDLLFGEDWILPQGSALAVKAYGVGGAADLGIGMTFFWDDE